MRLELLYNPRLILERIAEASQDRRRKAKLKRTVASHLSDQHMTSLEFIELAQREKPLQVIYDLGANAGTWTLLARSIVPNASIHAFEPIPNYQEEYLNSTRGLKDVTLHKVGAGAENKQEIFNCAGHSSSFLNVSDNLLRLFPSEKKTGEIKVNMVRLDDYCSSNKIPLPDLMKLDVEGYEVEVLKGAVNCMKHCRYIILEVSFIERHIGQALFHDVVAFMGAHRFEVCAFPYKMPLMQRVFMADILFKNTAFDN